jgi:hypothetical protein
MRTVFIIAIVAVAMIGVMVPSGFAMHKGLLDHDLICEEPGWRGFSQFMGQKNLQYTCVSSCNELETRDKQIQCLVEKETQKTKWNENYIQPFNQDYANWMDNADRLLNILGKEKYDYFERFFNTDLLYEQNLFHEPNIIGTQSKTLVEILDNYSKLRQEQNLKSFKKMIFDMNTLSDNEKVELIYQQEKVQNRLKDVPHNQHLMLVGYSAMINGKIMEDYSIKQSEKNKIESINIKKQVIADELKKHNSISEPTQVITSLGIASFVDPTKDPQHYIDRYNNEPTYKEWFDENYSQYSSIYEAVGLDESRIESTPEPIAEQVMEQKVNCGSGTELVNGICKVIQTEEKSSNGGGCLIATATYGSELAPQVQQLRELRDNQLLQTESGTAFMGTFNDIYYSFSPTIADMEREHPMFKEAVKVAITPMISSLSLMENAESESEVLSIGISVIMLNLGMYLGVPAIVAIGIRKRF